MSAYQVGVLIGSIGVGCIMGAIPAICGAVKGKIRLAVIGFFACVISGFLLGLLLSVPVCAVFVFLIFKRKPEKKSIEIDNIVSSESDAIDVLKQYQKLLDAGAITQEEFDAQKKQLLGL